MPWLGRSNPTVARIAVALAILLLLSPVGGALLLDSSNAEGDNSRLRQTATNVTFISTQGGSTHVYKHAGVLVGVHTDTGRVIWRHDRYRRYMDVDPLDSDRLLFVAGQRYDNGTVRRYAVVVNWRTGEVHERFRVPLDTHDVDRIGENRYAVADKASHRAYVYDTTTDSIRWEYEFAEQFPPSAGDGIDGDYTHLNDIDLVDDGTAFLLSPRNFDRVVSVDRANKDVRWTLGEEDEYGTLHEQHNPVLIDHDPLTVLVADSENDRVIEYRQSGSGWNAVWAYTAGLNWPRDADRLPNGNTLITDSANDRVIEVTPDRRVVWAFSIERGPYDAERLPHGDEPRGPPMSAYRSEFDTAVPATASEDYAAELLLPFTRSYDKFYQLVGAWILPVGAGRSEFVWLVLATALGIGWLSVEAAVRLPKPRVGDVDLAGRVRRVSAGVGCVAGLIAGASLLFLLPVSGSQTSVYAAVGMTLLNLGALLGERAVRGTDRLTDATDRLLFVVKTGLSGGSLLVAGVLVVSQLSRPTEFAPFAAFALAVLLSAAGLWTGRAPGGRRRRRS